LNSGNINVGKSLYEVLDDVSLQGSLSVSGEGGKERLMTASLDKGDYSFKVN
jgi:hypothetical protein